MMDKIKFNLTQCDLCSLKRPSALYTLGVNILNKEISEMAEIRMKAASWTWQKKNYLNSAWGGTFLAVKQCKPADIKENTPCTIC